jgi:hypothetical protein
MPRRATDRRPAAGARRARAPSPATNGIPVIALTALAMVQDKEKALAAGCDELDTEPVELPRLLEKIKAPPRVAAWPSVARMSVAKSGSVSRLQRAVSPTQEDRRMIIGMSDPVSRWIVVAVLLAIAAGLLALLSLALRAVCRRLDLRRGTQAMVAVVLVLLPGGVAIEIWRDKLDALEQSCQSEFMKSEQASGASELGPRST